jgi:hypothetical protein
VSNFPEVVRQLRKNYVDDHLVDDLIDKLASSKMASSEDVRVFTRRFYESARKIQSLSPFNSGTLLDAELVRYYKNSLPSPLRAVFVQGKARGLTFQQVKNLVFAQSDRLKLERPAQPEVYYQAPAGRGRSRVLPCHRCGGKDHLVRKCPHVNLPDNRRYCRQHQEVGHPTWKCPSLPACVACKDNKVFGRYKFCHPCYKGRQRGNYNNVNAPRAPAQANVPTGNIAPYGKGTATLDGAVYSEKDFQAALAAAIAESQEKAAKSARANQEVHTTQVMGQKVHDERESHHTIASEPCTCRAEAAGIGVTLLVDTGASISVVARKF